MAFYLKNGSVLKMIKTEKEQKIQDKLLSEIGGIDSDPLNILNTGLIIPNPDIILYKLNYSDRVLAFSNILSDPHVMAEVRALRAGILSWETQLKKTEGNESQYDFLKDIFDSLDIPTIMWHIAEAVLYGGSLIEIVYDRINSLFIPTELNDISLRRLVYNTNNEPRILTKDEMLYGIPIPDNKFILTRYMASYDNPYGESVLSRCYWPWRFKYSTIKCLAKLIERSGVPWVVAKYVSGMEQTEQDQLLYQLTQMREGGIIVLPDTFPDIEVKEIDPQSTSIFTDALEFYDRSISKVISLQTLATEVGDTGSYAAAETHHDREGIPQQEIRLIIEDAFNRQFIKSVLNVNPQFKSKNKKDCYFFFYEEDDARESWAKTLEIAAKSVFVPAEVWGEKLQIDVKEYEKPANQDASVEDTEENPVKATDNVEETEKNPDNENQQENTDFARQQKSENLPQIEARYEQDIDDSIKTQVNQIISMVNDASSYEEILEKVKNFEYSKDTEKVIRESSTLAWLAGILDAIESL